EPQGKNRPRQPSPYATTCVRAAGAPVLHFRSDESCALAPRPRRRKSCRRRCPHFAPTNCHHRRTFNVGPPRLGQSSGGALAGCRNQGWQNHRRQNHCRQNQRWQKQRHQTDRLQNKPRRSRSPPDPSHADRARKPATHRSLVINSVLRPVASAALVHAVARHAKWSPRREVRAALLRTAHLSLARALEFSREIPAGPLQELLASSHLPAEIKDQLLRESQTGKVV